VGLLRHALDLTRRRPELYPEIGTAEVVKGAVDAWRRRLVAGRRQKGGKHAPPERACPVRAGGGGGQLDMNLLKNYRVDCRLSVLKTLHHVRGLAAKVDDLRLNPT
jgi:hypothetical protein